VTEAPAYDRDAAAFKELIGNVRVEIGRISTAVYPRAEWADCVEIEMQLEAGP
jgi:hypothetical protein